jgi:glycine cleavage system H protein
MTLPTDRKYTKSHEWVKPEADGLVAVGITDHAQEMLGDLVYVESPAVGRTVTQGEECAVVESVKAAADVYAPVSGTVVATNADLTDTPEKINADAYATWIFKLKLEDSAQLAELLDSEAYQKIAAAEEH